MESTEPTSTAPTLEGVWELQHYYNYADDEVTDTLYLTDIRQIKMFSENKIVWIKQMPRDSTDMFGYGSYVIENDSLVENLEFGSNFMMSVIDTLSRFSFELQLEKDSYSQITVDPEIGRVFSENYKRVE